MYCRLAAHNMVPCFGFLGNITWLDSTTNLPLKVVFVVLYCYPVVAELNIII